MPKLWVKNGKNYSIWQYGTKLIPGFAKAVDADLMTSEMYAQLTQASTDPTATDQTEPGEDSTGQIGILAKTIQLIDAVLACSEKLVPSTRQARTLLKLRQRKNPPCGITRRV